MPDGKFNGTEEVMALSAMPAAAQKALTDAAFSTFEMVKRFLELENLI